MSWLIESSRASAPVDCSCSWEAPTPMCCNTLTPVLAYKGQVLWAEAEKLSRARNRTTVHWTGKVPSRVSTRVQGFPWQRKILRTLACVLRLDSTRLVQESGTSPLLISTPYGEVPVSHIRSVDSSHSIESFDRILRLRCARLRTPHVCARTSHPCTTEPYSLEWIRRRI